MLDNDEFFSLVPEKTEQQRYRTLLASLAEWKECVRDQVVLDFGCSWGTSVVALVRLGAAKVVGVEPDEERVRRGQEILAKLKMNDKAQLRYVSDTRQLPFADGEFGCVVANAVFEHIPQPRDAYLQEVWRVLKPGGVLFINETPNKYFPKEVHTTGLWFNHWLPKGMAYRRAIKQKRYDKDIAEWNGSGWRGAGFYEIAKPLGAYELIPERSKVRHRLLSSIGLPASLFDPYPVWTFRKVA